MRSGGRGGGPRAALPLVLVVALAAAALGGASCTKKEEDPAFSGGKNINAAFVPDQISACARADLLSLQERNKLGSTITLDLTLTDCDASMLVTGINFTISYDDSALDFIGCTKGSLFPSSNLAPGTPDCSASGGVIRGVIALHLPNTVRVGGGGSQDAVQLSFSATRGGSSSHATFTGTDSLSGTAVYLADSVTQTVTVYPLGGSGYSGGTFASN